MTDKTQNKSPLEQSLGQKSYDKLMSKITTLHFDHDAHQLVTGHSNGNLVIWK
jgi:hypothetical protein